jgi:branched-chain amino acid transport system substrate-binding protein
MKRLSILLIVLLAMVLSACNAATPATPAAPTEAAQVEPTEAPAEEPMEEATEAPAEEPTEAPAEEPTEAPAEEPTGEPLKIGVVEDLTGALALFGNETEQGLRLGFEYATDGTMTIAGRPIELIVRDDTGDVEASAAAARELIESEGVEVIIGTSSSAAALQIQQIAEENDVVYFAAPAASPDITGANFNSHTFRVCRNSAQDGLTIADYAISEIGTNYLILAEDYAFGQATAAGFEASFGGKGASFVAPTIFAPSDTSDFTPYIQQINEADPDGLILIWATNTSATILFEQLTSQGVTENIPLITGFSSNDLTRLLNPGNVGSVGLIVYHYSLPDTPANDYLTEQSIAQFETAPDLFSECGFATAQAVVAALEATEGETASEDLIAALEGLSFEGPKGTYTIRAEDHQALAPMYVVRLVNVDDPDDRFFELVEEVGIDRAAPPCVAETCN